MASLRQEPDDIELTNPATGTRMTLRERTGTATAEPLLEIEAWLPDGSGDVFRHLHPLQEERVRVLEGSVLAEIGGWSRTYSAGETFIVPAGHAHSLTAQGIPAAHVISEVTPPLRTANLVLALQHLATAGLVNAAGWPTPLPAAVIIREFTAEFVLAAPPALLRPRVVAALLPLAQVLGYHRLVTEFGTGGGPPSERNHSTLRLRRSEA